MRIVQKSIFKAHDGIEKNGGNKYEAHKPSPHHHHSSTPTDTTIPQDITKADPESVVRQFPGPYHYACDNDINQVNYRNGIIMAGCSFLTTIYVHTRFGESFQVRPRTLFIPVVVYWLLIFSFTITRSSKSYTRSNLWNIKELFQVEEVYLGHWKEIH